MNDAQTLLGQNAIVTTVTGARSLISRSQGPGTNYSVATLQIIEDTVFATLTFDHLDSQNSNDSIVAKTFIAGMILYNVKAFATTSGTLVAYWRS